MELLLAKIGAALMVGVTLFLVLAYATDPKSIPGRYWTRYVERLDKAAGLLFLDVSGKRIASIQLVLFVVVLIAAGFAHLELHNDPDYNPLFLLVLPVAVHMGPTAFLSAKKRSRIAALEAQIDSMIVAFANSLKTVPSPGAALLATLPLLRSPMREEIALVLKEVRLGNTLDRAIKAMSARLGSRSLDSALSAVLIGLQVGGDLPGVLNEAAAVIREMNRLDGVVRTKTAEGKSQLAVLAVMPFVIVLIFSWLQPGYFAPLRTTFAGTLVTGAAVATWVASLLTAKKVTQVDI